MMHKTVPKSEGSHLRSFLKYTVRVLVIILSTLLLIVGTLCAMILIIVRGPSPTAKRLFVLTVKETSAAGFLADMFLSEQEVLDIILQTDSSEPKENTDTSLIKIPPIHTDTDGTGPAGSDTPDDPQQPDDIEIVEVKGPTYHGKLMIVHDPSRIMLGTPDAFGEDQSGLTLRRMIAKYGATAGINAGGFFDPNGTGTGGIPDSIVIKDGKMAWGSEDTTCSVIGFDQNHILHVGYMTGKRALEVGVVEGVAFGPPLIVNGKPQNENRLLGGGINPRTAIGQRADGAVLLLVIEGRQITSLGVTYDDLVDIMLSYGAVNAANLDGGSSSLMVWGDEAITMSAYVYGERVLATAFLVK